MGSKTLYQGQSSGVPYDIIFACFLCLGLHLLGDGRRSCNFFLRAFNLGYGGGFDWVVGGCSVDQARRYTKKAHSYLGVKERSQGNVPGSE